MIRNSVKSGIILLLAFICSLPLAATTLKTPGEAARFTRYSQHADVVRFLSAVASQSGQISVQIVGKTLAVANFPAREIFLCILSEEGATQPANLNRSKPTILMIGSQHGNEQSAKEAVLAVIRDLAMGELRPLLRQLNFLIIPQANPYGNYYDQRSNELDLDLNRDHVKLETESVQIIHRVFRAWMPEVTMDVHERGDNYYRVAIGCVSNSNIHPSIQEFSRQQVLTRVEKKLDQQGITFHEYLVSEEMGLNTAAGANLTPEERAGKQMLLRYSTTDLNDGRNSLGIYQTLAFIQEGASRHDLATLKARTHWQGMGLKSFITAIAELSPEVLDLVRKHREQLVQQARTFSEANLIHLKQEYARDENHPTLTLKEFSKTDSPVAGVLKANRNAGDLVLEADLAPYPYPARQKVETRVVQNWFPRVNATLSVPRPLGYIIPARYAEVVDNLLLHDIEVDLFTQDCQLALEAYQITEIMPAQKDYLAPEKIAVAKQPVKIMIKAGDFYIACAQPGANLIPCLLEPQSDYGLIRYRQYQLVPEPGNFYAFYRLVQEQKIPLIPYQRWSR